MIEVSHLTKRYHDTLAVSDLSFRIEKGHIYGFLGPNGAGKSTTMNIITGCLAATSGDVKIGGYDIFEQPTKAKELIGYLPEVPPVYMDQTVTEYLTFVARAKGFSKSQISDAIKDPIQETHIEDVSERLIRHLSKGYRQRVGIAQALIGNPEVIILDEPTVGLDPMQILEIRNLIKTLGESHTVIISSHILSEIQAICDEVLIIHKGKLVAFDKLENLGRTLSGGNIIELRAECSFSKVKELLSSLTEIKEIEQKEENENNCKVSLSVGDADIDSVCRNIFLLFSKNNTVLLQISVAKLMLEDVFLEITKEADPASVPENTENSVSEDACTEKDIPESCLQEDGKEENQK